MIDNKGQESSRNSSSLENFTVRVTNPCYTTGYIRFQLNIQYLLSCLSMRL